jgi:hypothetical protein
MKFGPKTLKSVWEKYAEDDISIKEDKATGKLRNLLGEEI